MQNFNEYAYTKFDRSLSRYSNSNNAKKLYNFRVRMAFIFRMKLVKRQKRAVSC